MEFNKEDVLKMLEGKKKFFCKSFIVSVIFFAISVVLIMFGKDTWSEMAYKFYGLSKEYYGIALVMLMGTWKILIIQFTLIPAIVLCLMEKCIKSKMSCEKK